MHVERSWNSCAGLRHDSFFSPDLPLASSAGLDALASPHDYGEVKRHDADAPAEQKPRAAAPQRQAFGDVPRCPLGLSRRPTAHRADLAGVLDDLPVFWNVRRA